MKLLTISAISIFGASAVVGGVVTGMFLLARSDIRSSPTAPVPPRIAESQERKIDIRLPEPAQATAQPDEPAPQPPAQPAFAIEPAAPAMNEQAAALRTPAAPKPKSSAVVIIHRGTTVERYEVPSERWSSLVRSRRAQANADDDPYRDDAPMRRALPRR